MTSPVLLTIDDASVFGLAQSSAWVSGGNNARSHICAVHNMWTQPVAGQAEASSMVTSIIVSLPSSEPPNCFGVMRPYMPFSSRSVTFSAGTRRNRSASATRSRSLALSARARATASA